MESPADSGPYVVAALHCERALIEADGVVSLIRVVDDFRFALPIDAPPDLAVQVQVTLFVSLKAGSYRGPVALRLEQIAPNGERRMVLSREVDFLGEMGGAQFQTPLSFITATPGIYWTDVIVNDRIATRLPLLIHMEREELNVIGESADPN